MRFSGSAFAATTGPLPTRPGYCRAVNRPQVIEGVIRVVFLASLGALLFGCVPSMLLLRLAGRFPGRFRPDLPPLSVYRIWARIWKPCAVIAGVTGLMAAVCLLIGWPGIDKVNNSMRPPPVPSGLANRSADSS